MIAIVRLILAIVLFLASLLTVFHAPSYFLWEASIAVDELGHWWAIVGLILLLPFWGRRYSRTSVAFALIGTTLMLTPVVRSLSVSRMLPHKLERAFGDEQPRSLPGALPLSKPISFVTLFKKPSSPEVKMTTVTYVVRDGKPLQLDVYRRDRPLPPAPLVIAIHGGSWRSGGREDLPALNYYLASRGYVVASPSYRFAPEFPHPAASEDVDAAISFLEANARLLGIDSTKIILLGRSAGAQLALMAAYTRRDPGITGVVSLYGPTDQNWGWDNPADPRVYDSKATLREFLSGDPATEPAAYMSSSPINFIRPGLPATLMIHGTMDPLVSVKQSARLDSALATVDIPRLSVSSIAGFPRSMISPHLFIELSWGTHGCDYVFTGPCGQISTYAIERFVAAVTGRMHDPAYKFY